MNTTTREVLAKLVARANNAHMYLNAAPERFSQSDKFACAINLKVAIDAAQDLLDEWDEPCPATPRNDR